MRERLRGAGRELRRLLGAIRRHPRILLEAAAFYGVLWLLVRGVAAALSWDLDGASAGIGAGTGAFVGQRARTVAGAERAAPPEA